MQLSCSKPHQNVAWERSRALKLLGSVRVDCIRGVTEGRMGKRIMGLQKCVANTAVGVVMGWLQARVMGTKLAADCRLKECSCYKLITYLSFISYRGWCWEMGANSAPRLLADDTESIILLHVPNADQLAFGTQYIPT